MMGWYVYMFISSLLCVCSAAKPAEPETLEIATLSTTHVVFTSDLAYVDISKPDVIAAKVVDVSKNMLALKARKEFDFETTISCLEINGTMHTFKVCFNASPQVYVYDTRVAAAQSVESGRGSQEKPVAGSGGAVGDMASGDAGAVVVTTDASSNFGRTDAPTLEEVVAMPQQLFHVGDRCYRLEAYVTNLFVYSDIMYVVIRVTNGSDIGYESGNAQFAIESLVQNRKSPSGTKSVDVRSSYGNLSCAPGATSLICCSIPKITLLKNECLRIYIYETNGTRNMFLTLTDKDINYAVSPR